MVHGNMVEIRNRFEKSVAVVKVTNFNAIQYVFKDVRQCAMALIFFLLIK